nr:integrase, catalytic region, zinc finger, CCHC-type, peptidase aspartic, catalytic [Tanacetum cinerariifolium]
IIHICLWIIDSGCSKHMTGNRALLTNFVEKFLRMVRFGNNDFTVIAGYGDVIIGSIMIKKVYYVEVRFGNNDFVVIAGYGDVVIGSMTIKKVYYVEGLGHNLFSVG